MKIILLLLALLLLTVVAIHFGSTRWIKVYHHIIYFDDLPPHLEGFRILHFSDLHSNDTERMNLNIWRHIARLDFDMAAITGDIVLGRPWSHTGPILELEPHREHFAALAQRAPTFFVEGNHESNHFNQISQFMDEVGITFLHNQAAILEINGGTIEIIGTADFSTLQRIGYDGFHTLFNDLSDNFQVVLTHQPQLFDLFKTSGINLALAGHSHGGQVRLPFFPTIYAPNQGLWPAYGAGFYHYGDAVLYVSRGLGTTYFPVRFWNRPSISIIELRNRGSS